MHELAHWGARSLGPPPSEGALEPGWLAGTLRIALPPTEACIEFRIGEEVASVGENDVHPGPVASPDAVIETDLAGFYRLLVHRDLDAVAVRGRVSTVEELLETLPPSVPASASDAVTSASSFAS